MADVGMSTRFLESTRGRVLDLLRQGSRSVEELAEELALTPNAVRVHLTTLQRDGQVRENGVRRSGGVGKPATLYAITPEAENAFSRAYIPLLQALLATLADDMPERKLRSLMRDVGRRIAITLPTPHGSVRERVAFAADLLDELGGRTTVIQERACLRISGSACPLSAVVAGRPEVCAAMTEMLREITGSDVQECCEHGEHPRCRFEVRQ